MTNLSMTAILLLCIGAATAESAGAPPPSRPVPLIFDTDIGNDVDDVLALGVTHALQSRGECELLAVTITKDHELCGPFVDAVNTFYGRGSVPIGVVKGGVTPEQGKFIGLAAQEDNGALRYPHDLNSGNDAPDATALLRQVLVAQEDHSVVIAQVGFSTNLARLLDSGPDAHSELSGRDLVARKVRLLSIMAGAFTPIDGREHLEYNVVMDIPAARKLVEQWPVDIVYSGFEIGISVSYPAISIDHDYAYVNHHPLQEAYQLYMPTPHERPTWDLTSVLYGVRPDHGYFDLSPAGRTSVDEKGHTTFQEAPDGKHRYLKMNEVQAARVREALAQLASQPPNHLARQ
ncbi:MAG TPA: nucleoside hydrolase [Candidatus Hydrogenedentes bacterium]|nr:nucleoside hydrolase [Candidatus Hydrogenedentota bacterium]